MKHTWCRKISNTGELRITPNSFGNRCRGWRPMPNTKHTFHKCSQMNGSVSKKEKLVSGIVCMWETPKGSKLSARSSTTVYCIKKQKNWIQTCIECLNNCLQINVFPIPRKGARTFESYVYQFSSVTQSWQTLCKPMECSTPGFPAHHQLLETTQTHVHRISNAIQSSYPLSSPSPPTFNLSQHQGLFHWVSSSHQMAKYWSFSFSISPPNEYSGLISFRID